MNENADDMAPPRDNMRSEDEGRPDRPNQDMPARDDYTDTIVPSGRPVDELDAHDRRPGIDEMLNPNSRVGMGQMEPQTPLSPSPVPIPTPSSTTLTPPIRLSANRLGGMGRVQLIIFTFHILLSIMSTTRNPTSNPAKTRVPPPSPNSPKVRAACPSTTLTRPPVSAWSRPPSMPVSQDPNRNLDKTELDKPAYGGGH